MASINNVQQRLFYPWEERYLVDPEPLLISIHRRLSLMTFNSGLDQVVTKVSNFAADVERWYHMHRDMGMSLYFRATRPARNLPSYPDRFSFGLYLAKDSPKLQYMTGLVGQICRGCQIL